MNISDLLSNPAVWLVLAAIGMFFAGSLDMGKIMSWLKGLFAEPAATTATTLSGAIANYNGLMDHLVEKKCIAGQQQLEGVWVHLQPSHTEPTPQVTK